MTQETVRIELGTLDERHAGERVEVRARWTWADTMALRHASGAEDDGAAPAEGQALDGALLARAIVEASSGASEVAALPAELRARLVEAVRALHAAQPRPEEEQMRLCRALDGYYLARTGAHFEFPPELLHVAIAERFHCAPHEVLAWPARDVEDVALLLHARRGATASASGR